MNRTLAAAYFGDYLDSAECHAITARFRFTRPRTDAPRDYLREIVHE